MSIKIHIKAKNKGKFTASAKKAGKGVQEYAHEVMSSSSASPTQKKRANFAIQAKKWHHADMGDDIPGDKPYQGGFKGYVPYNNIHPEMQELNTPLQTSTSRLRDMVNAPTTTNDFGRDLSVAMSKTKEPVVKPFNWGQAGLLGLEALDAAIPLPKDHWPVVQPLEGYNGHPYGTGSQAIYQDGGQINSNPPTSENHGISKLIQGVASGINDINYQNWKSQLPKNLQYEGDYNLKQLFLDSGAVKPTNGHFPDTYKLPNHPTFSDESIYSNKEHPGGHWEGDKYIPVKKLQTEGVLPGATGSMYGRLPNVGKAKGNKQRGNFPILSTPSIREDMGHYMDYGGEVPPTKKQLADANTFAKAFAVRRGMITGEDTNVGNQVPQFVDTKGNVVGKDYSPLSGGNVSTYVPPEVKDLQWDADMNMPFYIDPQSGDAKYTSKDNFYSPRFRKSGPPAMTWGGVIPDMAHNNTGKTKKMNKMEDGGDVKPYYEEGKSYDIPDSEVKRLISQGYNLRYI